MSPTDRHNLVRVAHPRPEGGTRRSTRSVRSVHDRLSELRQGVVDALEASRAAAQVYDEDARLCWVSEQMLELAGADPSAEVGYGMHIAEGIELPLWASILPPDARRALREELERRFAADGDPAAVWVSPVELDVARRRRPVGMLGVTVRTADGTIAGTALVFAPLLPARVLALVSEGDEAMFTRMADLTEPRRRPRGGRVRGHRLLRAALPRAAHPGVLRADPPVHHDVRRPRRPPRRHRRQARRATARARSSSPPRPRSTGTPRTPTPRRAALAVALAFPAAVRAIVEALAAEGVGVRVADCRVNLGVHWGANLYIGQIVTGGRLEVTALGDEVNECARIEHVATGGQTLVSKTVLERLDADAARDLGIDPMTLTYRVLADLADTDRKALRDAGSLAVVDLAHVGDAAGDGGAAHSSP